MTTVSALCLCACALALASAAPSPAEKQFESRLTSQQIDQILKNPRTVENYTNCMIDKGPCTKEGKEIKKILPEALATSCAKCSPQLKANMKKTINAMRTQHPKKWEELVKKYDPKGEKAPQLRAFLQS